MNASLCRHGGLSRAVMIHRLWLRNSPSLRIQVIRSLSTVVPHRIQSSLPPPQGHQRTKTNEKLCKKVVDSRHDASPDQKVSSPSPTISSIRTAHMPMSLTFTGDTTLPITSHMHIVTPNEDPPSGLRPVYRLMVRIMLCVIPLWKSVHAHVWHKIYLTVIVLNFTTRTRMENFVIQPTKPCQPLTLSTKMPDPKRPWTPFIRFFASHTPNSRQNYKRAPYFNCPRHRSSTPSHGTHYYVYTNK